MEPELSVELQQQGWKKFWSKRENRPYFWNKLTGESLWVMPSLKPQVSQSFQKLHGLQITVFSFIYLCAKFDPITDPLGIGLPNISGNGQMPPGTPGGPLKRRASEDGTGMSAQKKFILAYVNLIYFIVTLL